MTHACERPTARKDAGGNGRTDTGRSLLDGQGKGYQAFWRRAESDGLWLRQGSAAKRIALEVKMHEDVDAPLCQVLDDLGLADAVINVRVNDGKKIDYRAAGSEMDALRAREWRSRPINGVALAA